MDSIAEIVSTLKAEDQSEFRRFLKRTKSNEDRKDLALFNLIVSNAVEPKAYSATLYPDGNDVAYQAARKRLSRLLSKYIALKMLDQDSSNTSQVINWVNMARYLYANEKPQLARKYLKKAENAAIKNDLYEVLNSIYVLHIRYLDTWDDAARKQLIQQWKQNKHDMEWNEKGEIALSIVSQKINEANAKGSFVDIDLLIQDTLESLGLTAGFLLHPRFVYNITSVNRKRMLVNKDFFNLEPFIIQQYELIQKQGGFSEKYSYYKLGFLYMIAHTLYRNKKFDRSKEYLHQLDLELKKASKGQQAEFYPKLKLLESNLLMFQHKLDDCIDVLRGELKHKSKLSNSNQLKFTTALGIALFAKGEYRETLKTLSTITHSDRWCEKVMGREWVLKKALMEVILYIDLQEPSLVDSRLRYVRRSFRKMLIQDKYKRVLLFINMLKKVANYPNKEELKKIADEMEESFDFIPMEYEDLQAVAFYAWLKAKLQQRKFYDVLLELVA